jgi:hypothetical protein
MAGLIALFVFAMSFDGVALVLGGWTDLDRIAAMAAAIVAYVPAGLLLDRFGVRRTGFASGVVWYFATLALDVGGPALVLPASIAIGVAVSVVLPLAVKATASWFPRAERCFATAMWVVAANLPIVLMLDPVFVVRFGAPFSHLVAVAVPLVAVIFYGLYRDADDPRTTHAERTYIENGGARPVHVPALGPSFAAIARSREVWALAFGFGAFGYAFGLGAVQVWGVAWSPLALIVTLMAGAIVDRGMRVGEKSGIKYLLGIFTLSGASWIGVSQYTGGLAAAYLTFVLTGYAIALPILWSLPGRIAPRGGVGTVAAIMALAAALGAAAVWWGAGDTAGAMIAAVVASGIFIFGLGRIEPIPDPV